MRRRYGEYLTAIDVGASAAKVAVGRFLPDDVIDIVGVGIASLDRQTLKGVIRDAQFVEERLERALQQAEHSAGIEIGDVVLSASSVPVDFQLVHGSAYTPPGDRRITEEVMMEALDTAHNVPLAPNRRALHAICSTYILDEDRRISHPIGQVANRLTAELVVVAVDATALDTLTLIAHEALGYDPYAVVFSPVADAAAVLSAETREKGVLLIDVGGSVTDFALFREDQCLHAGRVTVGCDHVANDLAEAFGIGFVRAQRLVKDLGRFGRAIMTPDGRKRLVELESAGGTRKIPASAVEQVIELRLRELFQVIREQAGRSDLLSNAGAGAVLCGGGACIHGVVELATDVLGLSVRTGVLQHITGLSDGPPAPTLHTAAGLIRYGHDLMRAERARTAFTREFRGELHNLWTAIRRALRF